MGEQLFSVSSESSPDKVTFIPDRYGFSGGQQYTDPDQEQRIPVKVIRARELKWKEMCCNWEVWALRRHIKLRDRCRKGIPDSFRSEAWQRLCSSPMMLIARPKVIAQGPPITTNRYKKTNIFGTLSRNSNTQSLPTVITTSPSFRVKRGKAGDRRRFLMQKLYGSFQPVLSPGPSVSSVLFEESKVALPSSEDVGTKTISSIPISILNSIHLPSPSADSRIIWHTPQLNGDLNNTDDSKLHKSPDPIHSSLRNLSPNVSFYENADMPSAYSTIGSVHRKIELPGHHIYSAGCTFDYIGVTRNSGGYASLSTTSGTDSVSTNNNVKVHILPPRTASTDSCASILTSSSIASSSSIVSHPNHVHEHLTQSELGGLEDPRATLVPAGDPDPVALYEYYCRQEGVTANCDQIRRDIDRQFPFHELFHQKGGHGQESLYTLLKAYTIRHPDKGYCQGQAPLAAVLLIFMPEVDAFWTFNEICERYLEAYYDDGLERVQIDGEILYALLKTIYPVIYKFLRKHQVDPILIVLEWFMCIFTRTLPWPAVLRVLDMFFCEGKVVLFRVAIVLLHRMFGQHAQRKACGGLDDILLRLREISSVVKNTEDFIQETIRVPLNPRDIAEEALRQSHKWVKGKRQK